MNTRTVGRFDIERASCFGDADLCINEDVTIAGKEGRIDRLRNVSNG
jgi:hypothetical protein